MSPSHSSLPDLSTVLVSGGAGFIGCALSRLLAPRTAQMVVLDNLHPQVHAVAERPKALAPEAELVVGDVTEPHTWDELLDRLRPEIVIHLAAETGTGQSLDESTRHGRVNVVGTTQMLDAFTRIGWQPRHILLSSSRAVYGEGQWVDAQGEASYPGLRSHRQLLSGTWDFPGLRAIPSTATTTTPHPTSVYAATKLAQEHLLTVWTQARSTSLSILRLQNVYGPGQSLTNSYTGIVALFSQLAREGQSIPLYEDGAMLRDFVYIEDVAAAFVAAIDCAAARPDLTAPVLDIGSGTASTTAEMAGILARFYGAPAPTVTGRFRDGDVRHAACRIDEASRRLNWQPMWDLERGLVSLQTWVGAVLAATR